MKKRTKIVILLFVLIFIVLFMIGYVKLGKFIDYKLESFRYEKALKKFIGYDKEGVKHFPKELPQSASKVEFEKSVHHTGRSFYLKMNVNEQWIKEQINSHKYIEVVLPGNYTFKYRWLTQKIEKGEFTYYPLYIEESNSYSQYYYGIAADEDNTQIIYFYVNFSR